MLGVFFNDYRLFVHYIEFSTNCFLKIILTFLSLLSLSFFYSCYLIHTHPTNFLKILGQMQPLRSNFTLCWYFSIFYKHIFQSTRITQFHVKTKFLVTLGTRISCGCFIGQCILRNMCLFIIRGLQVSMTVSINRWWYLCVCFCAQNISWLFQMVRSWSWTWLRSSIQVKAVEC